MRVRWAMTCVCLAACHGPTTEAPPQPPAAVASARSSAPTSVAKPVEEQKSRFSPVAHLAMHKRQAVELHALGNELVLDDGEGIFVTQKGVLVPDTRFQTALPAFYGLTGVAGSFPDDAWVSAIVGTESSGEGTLYRFDGGWKKQGKALPERWLYAGLADYGGGRKIALAVNYLSGPFVPRPYFEIVSGKKTTPGRPRTKLPELTPAKPGGACQTRLQPQAFIGFPSGRLVVYGSLCDTEEPALEEFAPGETKGRISVVESFKGVRCAVMGVDCGRLDAFFTVTNENDIWLVQTDAAVHFDGQSWKPFQLPRTTQPIAALSAAGQDVWLVAAKGEKEVGELWHRSGDGPWVREALPELPGSADDNHGATDVVALGDRVWVSADQHLLRSDYSGPVLEIEKRKDFGN